MIEYVLPMIVAFLITFIVTPRLIRYFKLINITTTDVHKKNQPLIASSAGIPIAAGLIGGLLVFVFINISLQQNVIVAAGLFAAMTTFMIILFAGFFDDLKSIQVRKDNYVTGKKGLIYWHKPLLTLPAAFPLMALMYGDTEMVIPFVGTIDFGIIYYLLIIPIGIVCASNMVNMLGGFNGLEIGMGLVYTLSLGIFALLHGSGEAGIIFLIAFASLLAIGRYNFSPAKILSGDSTTYILGAVIAVGSIVGNLEKAAIITSIPFIVQAILKFYGRAKLGHFPSDLGILQEDGTIKSRYGKSVYSWTHMMMRIGGMTEKKIVISMMCVQAVFAAIPFLGLL